VELIELLHLTRNSEIWLCSSEGMAGQLVIKLGLTPESRPCLEQEIAILRRVQAQSIPGVLYPIWEKSQLTGPELALTFRYIDGGSLANHLHQRDGKLSLAEVNQSLMPQLLQTYARLHRLNPPVIHGDTKPDNVLVDSSRLLVNDFGASAVGPKEKSGWDGEADLGQVPRAATPSYASLDQLHGEQPSWTDDIYSLVVLWCRLVGIDPIDDTQLPPRAPPSEWKKRIRPGLREQLQVAGLTPTQIDAILDGLGPAHKRPDCGELLRVLGQAPAR
jgi:serine/threonine protein kinase